MDALRNISATLLALLFTAQAQAITITSAGDTWTVDWNTTTSNGYALSATSNWTIDSFSSSAIELTISITNTTTLSGLLTNADITTFGFGIDPNATVSIIAPGSTFDMAANDPNQNFPGGYKDVDICIYADGCSGGNTNNGLQAGASDTIRILLSGDFTSGFANLLYFPLKFQTNFGSYEPAGCVNGNCPSVPEPSIPVLLVTGVVLITLLRSLRRQSLHAQC